MPAHLKSISSKQLAGTDRPSRRKLAPGAAKLTTPPPAPRGLSPAARAAWKSVAPLATALGTLTESDLPTLRLLAETLGTAADAEAIVARAGFTIPTADGGMKKHPAVAVLETARAQARALLDSFGLSPRGRQMVDTSPAGAEPAEDNPYARIRQLRGEL